MFVDRSRARVALIGAVLVTSACSEPPPSDRSECPNHTEPLAPADVVMFHELEKCAGDVHGMALEVAELPRVEVDPELVPCVENPSQTCITGPGGKPVAGVHWYYCNTLTVSAPPVILHESLHAILCGVPELDCDGEHLSPAWGQCQLVIECDDGTRFLGWRFCDGKADCEDGTDEALCPED